MANDTPVLDPQAQAEFIRQMAARRAGANPIALPSPQMTGMPAVSTVTPPKTVATATPASVAPPSPTISGLPPVGAPPQQQPTPAKPEDQRIQQAQTRLDQAEKPAGVVTLMDKAKRVGGDHPGILGKIGRIGAEIGAGALRGISTAGDVIAPGISAAIPGTGMNRNVNILGARTNLDEAIKGKQQNAMAEQENAKADLEKAQSKQVGMLGAGKTPTDQLIRDLMLGGPGGTPKLNPKSAMPYTMDEAITAAIEQAKAAGETPENQPLSKQPDLMATYTGRIDQFLPNATPEQRKAFYPAATMTAGQADKLVEQASKIGTMSAEQQQREFERKRQEREEGEKKAGNNVEWMGKDGKLMYGSQSEAEAQKVKWIKSKKGADDIRHDTALLNDMQAKLNDVTQNRAALDQDGTQKTIIAKVLSTTGGGSINIAGQHIPLAPERGGALDQLIQAGMLQDASDSTVNYIQAVLSFRESALALPKMITNSGRQSEIAARALWATTPGLEPNSNYALGQARRFQQNLDRLRKTTPTINGEEGSIDQPVQDLKPPPTIINPKTGETATWDENKKGFVDKNGRVVK